MSEFFKSDIIQEELNDINRMQEKIYEKVFLLSVQCPVKKNLNTLIC